MTSRRQFISLLSGAAAAWPAAARGQQPERVRRIGVLLGYAEDDPEIQTRLAGFRDGLDKLGWSEGRTVRVDYRFAPPSADREHVLAKELVALQPDVILAHSPLNVAALQRESRRIPIVFVGVSDPVGTGLVASLAHPGGNLTGLMSLEASITGKWLTMLKEVAPRLTRVALMANSKTILDYYVRAAAAMVPSIAIELVSSPVKNTADIGHAIESFGRVPGGGLVLPPDVTTSVHRNFIIALAARHRLPAVYALRPFVVGGGLMSYGVDYVAAFRQAASYVDRILRGAKPSDLPVQAPTKYETVINLTTAKALGLSVPPVLLVAADEVIE